VIVADGYPIPNAEKEEEGDYWITFDGNKYRVPSVAVIHNTPNPIGVPIAWNGNYRHGVRSKEAIELLKLIKSLR